MLKGKRAVITGGGRDFGQAVAVWLAREGVEVDLCARTLADAQATVDIITQEGGIARAYACDLSESGSVTAFAAQLSAQDTPVDILLLSAAQWLEGDLAAESAESIFSTINSGLTGSVILTQALLPALRRSAGADIITLVSVCGIPQFTESIAHPAFFAARHGISGFSQNLAHHLAKENIRVTGLYPPDFEVTGLDVPPSPTEKMGESLLNARSVWETIRFVLSQPRSCHISTIYFQGPTRQTNSPQNSAAHRR